MKASRDLWIMRHAKSAWPEDEPEDLKRPLARRGKRDASTMANWLSGHPHRPEVIISSPAQRARSTAKHFKSLSFEPITTDARLYRQGVWACLHTIRDIKPGFTRALIIGHNPDLEELVTLLTGQGTVLKTSTIAHVRFEKLDWQDIRASSGLLLSVTDRHRAALSS